MCQSPLTRLLLPVFAFGCGVSPHAAPSSASESRAPAMPLEPAPVSVSSQSPDPVQSAVAAQDRSADDRALDEGRKPAELLTFFGIARDMRVAELSAGGGYTTELLARVVGSNGEVYAQNSRVILERFAETPFRARLAQPVMSNVVRVDRELDDPLPPEARELDAIIMVLFYHDSVWMKTDRDRMNRAVFAALKPGGVYGIVDHAGRDGTGVSEAETLHRIEEKVVRDEVQKAGFVLDGEAAFLRNPADARDWNASPRKAAERRGTSDRFVLRFKKPAKG